MTRDAWIDSTRFFAIFVIMTTHFLADFYPAALSLWVEPPAAYLLSGLTGKFSVAFFSVLLGYFASKPRDFSFPTFFRYTLKRYFQFSFSIFLVEVLYLLSSYCSVWLFHSPDANVYQVICDGFPYNLLYLFRDSLLFESTYNSALWCMGQFFAASVLCFLCGSLLTRAPLFVRFFSASALYLLFLWLCGGRFVWVSNCILGYILRLLLSCQDRSRLLTSRSFIAVVFILSVLLIKAPLPEGLLLYILEGFGALLLLITLFHLPRAQHLLAVRPFPWLGRVSIGLYICHTPINAILASTIAAPLLSSLQSGAAIFLCYILSLALSILCAGILNWLYSRVSSRLFPAKIPVSV